MQGRGASQTVRSHAERGNEEQLHFDNHYPMNFTLLPIVLAALAAEPATENPVFKELVTQGVTMSDGAKVKLPPPIMADGLDAAGQLAALRRVADARNPVKSILEKSFYASVVTKIRAPKPAEGERPTVWTVNTWFVAHGNWNKLTSKEFLESLTSSGEGKGGVVSKAGALTDEEMQKRKLKIASKGDYEERFLYATFSLFERVEISSTRFAAVVKGKDSVLAAGRVDPRFDRDAEYPNQWRPLLRDVRAEIKPGPAHPFGHAGGYAKITRLVEPAGAVFIECHVVYEEPYGWFDGVNLIQQKVPAMVREKVRSFRRKLSMAEEEKSKTP